MAELEQPVVPQETEEAAARISRGGGVIALAALLAIFCELAVAMWARWGT